MNSTKTVWLRLPFSDAGFLSGSKLNFAVLATHILANCLKRPMINTLVIKENDGH